jgi:isoleucyl-tRNA synthetase
MRKEANFDVDDRIILSNNFSDEIASAIEKHKQYFMNEILCTDIVDKLENSDYNSLFSYEKKDFSIFIKKKENK